MPIGEMVGYGLSQLFTQDEQRRQRELEEEALADLAGLRAPMLQDVGVADIGRSAFEDVSVDPTTEAAQREAVAALMQRGREGFGVEDRSVLNRILGEAAAQERGQRMAIQSRTAGGGGSGQALALQQMAAQGAADRASQTGTEWAAQSRRAALDAIASGAGLAGQMRSQQSSEQARKAEARDRFRMYQTQAQQAANYYNAGLPMRQYEVDADARRTRAGAKNTRAGQIDEGVRRAERVGTGIGRDIDRGMEAGMGYLFGMASGGMTGAGGGSSMPMASAVGGAQQAATQAALAPQGPMLDAKMAQWGRR